MAEYIELEAAIKEMSHMMRECFPEAVEELDAVITTLKEIPAADVVEVVRCRDCKHYNAGFECLIEGYGIERPSDYFCADGERKDGGQDDA